MEVVVERSRRKTLMLTISREGVAVVRAPLTASDEAVRAFVSRHEEWLKKRLALRKTPALADGEKLEFFGEPYTIATGRAARKGGTLFLPAEGREGALAALLKRLSAPAMRELTAALAARYGFSYAAVRISSAHTRWGSCNRKGNISYSFRIAFLPPELMEYVALHELCHTRVLNHSAAFWREVAKYMPDYARRRKRLRTYEWCMNFL